MPRKPPSKRAAITKIIFAIFLCVVELSTQNHGLVAPVNAQAMGFDIWGVAVYLFCLWAFVTGIRTLYSLRRG